MNAKDFVRAIRAAVCDAAARGTIDLVQEPPGKHPDPQLVTLSHWLRSLTPEDRNNVARIAELSADQATYNFLLVLDGLLTLEPVGAKGKLELFCLKGQTRTQLNSGNSQQLSVLFKT